MTVHCNLSRMVLFYICCLGIISNIPFILKVIPVWMTNYLLPIHTHTLDLRMLTLSVHFQNSLSLRNFKSSERCLTCTQEHDLHCSCKMPTIFLFLRCASESCSIHRTSMKLSYNPSAAPLALGHFHLMSKPVSSTCTDAAVT